MRDQGSPYGDVNVALAVSRHLERKNFQDGTLDLFVSVRVADPDPSADLHRIYEIVSFFGSRGREVRGMKRNPDAKRNVRIFVVGDHHQLGTDVPESFLGLAKELHAEMGVDVAINKRFGHMNGQFEFEVTGESPWLIFRAHS